MVETGHLDDADLVVIGFGYAARFMKYAVKLLRDERLKIGFVRPITLWPFPKDAVAEAAERRSTSPSSSSTPGRWWTMSA